MPYGTGSYGGGAGAAPFSTGASVSSTDSGAITETQTVSISITSTDTLSAVDTLSLTARITSTDSAGAIDTQSLSAIITSTDTAAFTEAGTATEIVPTVAVPDALASIYENVGLSLSPTVSGSAEVYENVGLEVAASDDAFSYSYSFATSDVPTPHIWYLTPSSGRLGDAFTVVGMGFGSTEVEYLGSVLLEQQYVPPIFWGTIAAGADAYDADRRIDPGTDTATTEHQRIQALIPETAQSGYVRVVLNV